MRGPREKTNYIVGFCLLIVFLSTSTIMQAQSAASGHQFLVFDGTMFTEKPDLAQYGIRPISVMYEGSMWASPQPSDKTSLPDQKLINTLAQKALQTTGIAVIDIERWPLTGDPALVAGSVSKYQTVLQWFKTDQPGLKVGYYGVAPTQNYWAAIQETTSSRYTAWQKTNDTVTPSIQYGDILFPSAYTFYEDRDGWVKYAVAQIREARRLAKGKPVYVFLWPEYHVSNKLLGNTFLPGDYWRTELETARKYADGAVIWCCPNKQVWNNSASWWLETQKFMKETGSSTK